MPKQRQQVLRPRPGPHRQPQPVMVAVVVLTVVLTVVPGRPATLWSCCQASWCEFSFPSLSRQPPQSQLHSPHNMTSRPRH